MCNKQDTYRFTAVESHTVGEPTRIITSGFPNINGMTMMEKKQTLEEHYDHFRSALMCEPRGHSDMVGALLLPPVHEEADIGVVFMDANRWVNMCGHASMGCASYVVEAGMVSVKEPYTKVIMDTPAGLVAANVKVVNGKAMEVTILNVPSFLYQEHVSIAVEGICYDVAIAFGGTFFALLDVTQLHLELNSTAIEYLIPFTKKLVDALNAQLHVKHPVLDIERVVNVEYYSALSKYHQRCIVIAEEGQVDRSPCGTGTSAKLAYMAATGKLASHEVYTNESFMGVRFQAMYEENVSAGKFAGIRPQITGRAFLIGKATYVIDEEDPLTYGFLI